MPGEVEAATAIGMPRWRILQRILLPQIIRYSLPGLSNVWQMSLKDSALVSVTGIVELMRASQIAAGSTRDYFLFYLIGGGCYLILTLLSNRAFYPGGEPSQPRLAASQRRAGVRSPYVYRFCLPR
ncbi:amino acid ABC transporter permease [Klebsiella variicola]|uniref:Amino acid ABC transporter permease n=1 Tax=Klebsiella variicola TaxID=244366 RepID=A0A7H4MIE6_KLEVA|nr:amino acid ABC transporter permease [Klebsiella variicola]